MKRKPTAKQREQERRARRRHIRRGMRIAFFEANQVLAAQGLKIVLPPWFIPYTVAIAEGGRRNASPEDRTEALQWHVLHDSMRRIERLEREVQTRRDAALIRRLLGR